MYLFEQNKDIGEKLKTTGGGRMNVTNKVFSPTEFSSEEQRWVQRLFKNPHFEHRFDLLEKLGIEYEWEKNRAILKSQDAVAEVARLKELVLAQKNVSLCLDTKIAKIEQLNDLYEITAADGTVYDGFDSIVVCSGGMYRMRDLGKKEHIYSLPLEAEHAVTDVSVSLCPLLFKDKALREFSGISFVGRLTDMDANKSVVDDMLITHYGVSGPCALDFSALRSQNTQLGFITQVTEKDFVLEFNVLRNGKNSIKKYLKKYLPNRLVAFHLERAGITQDFIADLPKAQLKLLVDSLFHYVLAPARKNSFPEGWTTKGGVALKNVKTKNLESKLHAGMYFAGEVLDFNGLCGGYNISFAMVSAQIVADDILKKEVT